MMIHGIVVLLHLRLFCKKFVCADHTFALIKVLTIFALICWFPGTPKTNTGNPGSQLN